MQELICRQPLASNRFNCMFREAVAPFEAPVCSAGVDWRQKMENQRGAVLATELKNNANKLAKWTAAALVSGADMIKLGYVSRVHMRDNFHHAVLGTQVGCYGPNVAAAVRSSASSHAPFCFTHALSMSQSQMRCHFITCSWLPQVTSLEACTLVVSQKACSPSSPLKHV